MGPYGAIWGHMAHARSLATHTRADGGSGCILSTISIIYLMFLIYIDRVGDLGAVAVSIPYHLGGWVSNPGPIREIYRR